MASGVCTAYTASSFSLQVLPGVFLLTLHSYLNLCLLMFRYTSGSQIRWENMPIQTWFHLLHERFYIPTFCNIYLLIHYYSTVIWPWLYIQNDLWLCHYSPERKLFYPVPKTRLGTQQAVNTYLLNGQRDSVDPLTHWVLSLSRYLKKGSWAFPCIHAFLFLFFFFKEYC